MPYYDETPEEARAKWGRALDRASVAFGCWLIVAVMRDPTEEDAERGRKWDKRRAAWREAARRRDWALRWAGR